MPIFRHDFLRDQIVIRNNYLLLRGGGVLCFRFETLISISMSP